MGGIIENKCFEMPGFAYFSADFHRKPSNPDLYYFTISKIS